MRAWLDLDGFGGRMDLAFTGLAHTVRTGRRPGSRCSASRSGPTSTPTPRSVPPSTRPWRSTPTTARGGRRLRLVAVRHVTDVGGDTGRLLADVLRHRPHLRGTLADLPETAARGRQYLAGLGLDTRCDVVGQSFFDPLPAGADVYLLNRVIHDWDDAPAIPILHRCAEAAGAPGRVLVIESTAPATTTRLRSRR